jgi:hypothetical protein
MTQQTPNQSQPTESNNDPLAIHYRAIAVDMHADTVQRVLDENVDLQKQLSDGHLDAVRAKAGGLDAQFFLSGSSRSCLVVAVRAPSSAQTIKSQLCEASQKTIRRRGNWQRRQQTFAGPRLMERLLPYWVSRADTQSMNAWRTLRDITKWAFATCLPRGALAPVGPDHRATKWVPREALTSLVEKLIVK